MNAVVRPGAQIERDRFGRPLVTLPDGSKQVGYRRCTTFIDVLDDRYNLELWKQRQVADGLARRPDLVLKAAAAAGDKNELNEVTKQALEAAGSSSAATTGSAVHSLTEQVDRGQDPVIPPTVTADIDAYRATTSHLKMQMIEVFVVHDELQVGGTFDRVVEIDGVLYVADIKTGSIDYAGSKIAMQLAFYSRSRLYDVRSSRKGLIDASPPTPPSLHDLIGKCADVDSLRELWATHENEWTDDLTAAAKAHIAALKVA